MVLAAALPGGAAGEEAGLGAGGVEGAHRARGVLESLGGNGGDLAPALRVRPLVAGGCEGLAIGAQRGIVAALKGEDVEGETLDRLRLLSDVWGPDESPTTRTIDTHVLKLRKKIERVPEEPRHLLTVHGIGYRFTRRPQEG